MKKLADVIMRIARSKYMAAGVSLVVRRFINFLPVKVLAENEDAVMIVHPKPTYKIHYLIIPKKRIMDVKKLTEMDEEYDKIVKFICDNVCKEGKMVVCNFGERQEVKQLHFHVINGTIKDYHVSSSNFNDSPFIKVNSSYYIEYELMKDNMITRHVVNKASIESPKGFSIIWY